MRVMKICEVTVMRLKILAKKIKERDFSEVERENASEELESECETDEDACNMKKYLIFKFPKKHVRLLSYPNFLTSFILSF